MKVLEDFREQTLTYNFQRVNNNFYFCNTIKLEDFIIYKNRNIKKVISRVVFYLFFG